MGGVPVAGITSLPFTHVTVVGFGDAEILGFGDGTLVALVSGAGVDGRADGVARKVEFESRLSPNGLSLGFGVGLARPLELELIFPANELSGQSVERIIAEPSDERHTSE